MNEETNLPEGLQLAVKLLAQIGDDDSDRAIAAVHAAADERDNLIDAMREEIDEGLRLRELGGALPGENITAMTERVIKERDDLRARLAEMNSSYAHDAVWEALQRMIEDGQTKGPASREDALTVARHRDRVRLLAARPVPAQAVPDVDALAQYIRSIDGQNSLGAGALAERIVEWMEAPEHKA